jgi:hypothetical protein
MNPTALSSLQFGMHIAFALFADAANLSQEGKLNILGVFDAVQVGALPSIHPRATVVVRLKGTPGDAGQHLLAMRWVNPRGEELWSSKGQVDVGAPPMGVAEMDLPLIASLDLPLDVAGTYTLRIALDDVVSAELPLVVRAAAQPGVIVGPSGPMLVS